MPTPKIRRVLRLPQVMEKTGLRRDSIYDGGREGWFPVRVKLTKHASGWFEDEVDAWLAKLAAERTSAVSAEVSTQGRGRAGRYVRRVRRRALPAEASS